MPNRLAREDSPYLQQHKHNPVDWYPWCDEAFSRAEEESRPLFISIGYSSCHWCHVMEHDVFENPEIAAFLNARFICIKVDREERPDVDKYYQEVHRLLNRRPGGWPASIFCTPQNRPVYAATYIPPQTRDRMMGFSELTAIIAEKVAQHDRKLFESADEIVRFLGPKAHPKEATVLKPAIITAFMKQAEHTFEPEHGGFSQQPKFPHASMLNALLDIYLLHDNANAGEMVRRTLGAMHRGGMYDLVDGGFCRYSVDGAWLVPHFEKMTYDNGVLCELYARAGRVLGDTSLTRTAKEIADFMMQKMRDHALFYSASDADSEGHEGTYFIFGFDEVQSALLRKGFDAVCAAEIMETLHVTAQGNFEGKNIVRLETPQNRPEWFNSVIETLKEMRAARQYPFVDRKAQTSWNAMMIRGLFELGKSDAAYQTAALESLESLMAFLMPGGRLFHTAVIHGEPKVEAFLEDYAFLGTACIMAYESTLEDRWLVRAQQLANKALEHFFERGRWYFSRGEFTTDADASDASYPGSVGVIVDLLLSLGILVDGKYRTFAFKTLEYYSAMLAKTPIHFPYLFNQAVRYLFEDLVVKAKPEKLLSAAEEINGITYPFVHRSASSDDAFMLCGINSCFASVDDAAQLGLMISEKFSAN